MLTIIYSEYAFLFDSGNIFVKERIGRKTWKRFIDGKEINGFYFMRRKSDLSAGDWDGQDSAMGQFMPGLSFLWCKSVLGG